METVTIPKKEYEALKKKAKQLLIDEAFIESMTKSFEDIKHGRVSEWKPKPK